MAVTVRSEQRAFGGVQGFYEHPSARCGGPMRFGVYLPPQALGGRRVPAVYFLAGLTCNEETFAIKAGAQRVAAALGLALVTPDTSPRAARFPGDDSDWDFGLAASFYLDATRAPWSGAYRMESYVVDELSALVEEHFSINPEARGIMGHSMGGHGALSLALKHPGRYQSASALAPIVAPSEVPWGQKAFAGYLGDDRAAWRAHDTVALIGSRRFDGTLKVDQGLDDKFLARELQPERLRAACEAVGQPLALGLHQGYDHSYYFVASFVEAHLTHHAARLCG
ncbi:MAG: S-formylglutathione hydrolase [Myxococcales bacterium]|nr:S-formylglutathione hydrolase [Myxococcales bacterium]